MMFSSIKRTLKKKGRGTAEFSGIQSKIKQHDIGTTDACPYCYAELESVPVHDTACLDCGEMIIVVARPSDNVTVLLTEKDLARLKGTSGR